MLRCRRHRLGACAAVLAVGCLSLAGCEFKGGESDPAGQLMDGYWQPWPAALRVYPSSRFVVDQDAGRTVLEARIELRDEMDDAVKASGDVRFELFASDADEDVFERRLYRWDVQMRTLEAQRTHFDGVTRTYLFRLELGDTAPAGQPMLRVTFTAADGRRLQAEAPIDGAS